MVDITKEEIKEQIDFYYDSFLDKASAKLETLLVASNMTGEEEAGAITSLLDSSQRNAILAVKIPYELKDAQASINIKLKQLEDTEASITLKNIQASLYTQKLNHEAELNPIKIASAQLDKETKEHKLLVTTPLVDAKQIADTSYIGVQSAQLVASVSYNNMIKALDSLASLFGTSQAGGLVIPDTGWNAVFSLVNNLSDANISATGFQNGIKRIAEPS